MTTTFKEALKTLHGFDDNPVELDELEDGSVRIHILPLQKTEAKTEEVSGKSKWAKMAEENLLRDGLGDELRGHVREFRQNFVMKDSFDIEKNENNSSKTPGTIPS